MGGVRVSLSTVYNTLHKFSSAGLLKEVVVITGRIFFDTNINAHHHFIDEESGLFYDISENEILLKHLPVPPKGLRISGVDVVIRVVKAPF